MTKQSFLAVLITTTFLLVGCNEKEVKQTSFNEKELKQTTPIKLDTMDKKLSYLFAFGSASQIQELDVKFDVDVVRQAVEDANNGIESRLSEKEAQELSREFQRLQRESKARASESVKENNIELGAEYRVNNGKKEGVTTTDSGLQYEIIASGDGETPAIEDSVLAHYEGKLLDGTVFDSSIDRGEPAHFPLRGVIPGWTEVLQLMKTGDKWKVTIPYDLAYPDGTRGIDAGSTLIFEIELIKVIKERKS